MKKISFAFIAWVGALFADGPGYLRNSYNPAVCNGANVWVDVDVLYWKPWEKALVATNRQSSVFFTDDFTQMPVVHPHFQWDLGYRVSAGYLFSSHCWSVEGSWTHYTSWISQHLSTNGNPFEGMFPIWSLASDVIPGDYVFESDLKWKISINMLDLQLNRFFALFQCLEINPFLGLRSAWIKQHGDVSYDGGMFLIGILTPGVSLNGTDFIQMKNNYWGMGPRVGIAPRVMIGKRFGLNAEAAITGLYGFFKIYQNETYLDTTRFFVKGHRNRFRWIADFAAGTQWKTLFDCERYALTFKVDWEYHIFWHQFELTTDDFDLISHNRDLSTQGVTFSARFDF